MEKSERISAQGIDKEIVKSFKEYVREKYGKLHTVYGLEIGRALAEYLDKRDRVVHTHAHTDRAQEHKSEESKENRPKGGGDNFHLAYANSGGLEDRNEPGISPSERTKRKIIHHLEENGMMDATRISENAVRRIIAQIAGQDKRTINKYFCILEEEWLLPENMERNHSWSFARSPHFKGKNLIMGKFGR